MSKQPATVNTNLVQDALEVVNEILRSEVDWDEFRTKKGDWRDNLNWKEYRTYSLVELKDLKYVTIENLNESIKEVFKEVEDEKEKKSITFSCVSQSTFSRFEWQASEEYDTDRAKLHLEEQLSKFVVGRNNYKLYDVHTRKNILSLKDDKTGSLSGGTDLILAPYGLDIESSPQQCCVTIELKTAKAVMEASSGLHSFIGQ
eukprot:gene17568-24385_t